MKFLIVLLILSSTAFASDNECEKTCKSEYEQCSSKVRLWAEDKYIELEGLSYYSLNSEYNDSYDEVRKQEKALKKSCKEQKKSCLELCE